MKKLLTVLLAGLMAAGTAMAVGAAWEPEDDFLEVAFTINHATETWKADGVISDGEYFEVELKDSWMSYATNTDDDMDYAKSVKPKLYMSWDESYVYFATVYTENEYENKWDSDPASMWYSGCVQMNFAEFDEVSSEYRLEYGFGKSSDTGDMLYNVWADGAYLEYMPNKEDQQFFVDGDTVTAESRTPWSAFYEDFAPSAGKGFNFCVVWSVGTGTNYVHIQLAEGCTGNGKHAENFAQVTLAGEGSAEAAAETKAVTGEAFTSSSMFTNFDTYKTFSSDDLDPVYMADETWNDYYTGAWDSAGDNGCDIEVAIIDGAGYNGTKALGTGEWGNSNVGLYLYATDKNGIKTDYSGAQYVRVWCDFTSVGFRKANFGLIDDTFSIFSTDEKDVDLCPFYYSADGVNWTEMYHGGDGCFGDAQNSDVYGLKGWFAFPIADMTIRNNANWGGYDEGATPDVSKIVGVYMFWDYSDNNADVEIGNYFYLDNIELVADYTAFEYDATYGGGLAAGEEPVSTVQAEETTETSEATETAETTETAAETVAETVTEAAETVEETVEEAAETAAETVTEAAETAEETVTEAAEAAADTAADAVNTASEKTGVSAAVIVIIIVIAVVVIAAVIVIVLKKKKK